MDQNPNRTKSRSNAGTSGVIGGKQKPPYDSGDNYNGTFRESNVGGRGNRNTVNVGNRPDNDDLDKQIAEAEAKLKAKRAGQDEQAKKAAKLAALKKELEK